MQKSLEILNLHYNRAITTLEVIDELITLSKELDAAGKRGENHGPSDSEVALNDTLASNNSTTNGSARMSVMVKHIFNSSGYT